MYIVRTTTHQTQPTTNIAGNQSPVGCNVMLKEKTTTKLTIDTKFMIR